MKWLVRTQGIFPIQHNVCCYRGFPCSSFDIINSDFHLIELIEIFDKSNIFKYFDLANYFEKIDYFK